MGARRRTRDLFSAGTKGILALGLPLAVFIVVAREAIILVWVGDEFVAQTSPLLGLLVLFFLGYVVSRPAHALLVGTGRIKWYLLAYAVMATGKQI